MPVRNTSYLLRARYVPDIYHECELISGAKSRSARVGAPETNQPKFGEIHFAVILLF